MEKKGSYYETLKDPWTSLIECCEFAALEHFQQNVFGQTAQLLSCHQHLSAVGGSGLWGIQVD